MSQSVSIGQIIRVILPRAVPTALDYRCIGASVGSFVDIPLGKAHTVGVVVEMMETSPFQNLKTATVLDDVPPLAAATLKFLRWCARYTLSAPGEPLRAGLPSGKVPAFPKKGLEVWSVGCEKLATLNDAQQLAADRIAGSENFTPFLLDGVTGSGKTEVYFHSISQKLAAGGQQLVLLPEIALTAQWLQRFEDAFGVKPLIWHANITPVQRAKVWWRVVRGENVVVVGARSALFLPWQQLDLLIVDEEHDPSYKQDEGFRYHGRNMAVALAQHHGCPVVLASATPSLETFQHASQEKYVHLVLPQRYGTQQLPKLKLLDLRKEKFEKNCVLAESAKQAVEAALAKGEQVLLFLNRRGNAPLLLCTECGYRRDCSRCSASMTVHGDKLLCHHCGLTEPWPDACPDCDETDWRAFGVGTRSLFLEAQKVFPHARIAVADSDEISTPKQQRELVENMQNGDIDVLVGTQMMAKGHHFPKLTCVVVLDGDMGLAQGDVRAAEKTFQLMVQVAGRAGRELAGQVCVQTYQPEHALFQTLKTYDRDTFYGQELKNRKNWGDPPFGRHIALILSGAKEHLVKQAAQVLVQKAPKDANIQILGPAPAPMAKVRDKYRYRILVKGKIGTGHKPLQTYVKAWVEAVAVPHSVRVAVDVDPHSFM